MKVICARNVEDALYEGLLYLQEHGIARESRNGPVIVAPTPVTTVYSHPQERVLLDPVRDANPFFHLVESVWMLAGRNDLATLTTYVKDFWKFSDDGNSLHGAYGHRWLHHFDRDQLSWAIERLRKDPGDRRTVIQMYDPRTDQAYADGGKDVPCNLSLCPWIDQGEPAKLCMTIFCRSNDIIMGAYGANAVHFSILQEVLATSLGLHPGPLYQVSNNYHAYLATMNKAPVLNNTIHFSSYERGEVDWEPINIGFSFSEFQIDLKLFFDHGPETIGINSPWLRQVVLPVFMAHKAWRDKKDPERYKKAYEILEQCAASDWRRACREWLQRRELKAQEGAR